MRHAQELGAGARRGGEPVALRLALVAAAALLMAVPPVVSGRTSVAHAQDAATTARRHFQRGVGLFESGDFSGALAAFRDAYRARPHPSVLVNMANCYVGLERPVEAAAAFERYLREAGGDLDADGRAEVERALGAARTQIATIDVDAPPGTTVFVDGDPVGRVPLRRPAEVNPGPHVVELRAPDGRTATERVTVERGGLATVRPGAGSAQPPPAEPPATGPGATPPPSTPPPSTPPPSTPPGSASPGSASPGAGSPLPPGAGDPAPGPAPPTDDGGGLHIPVATWIAGGVAVVALVGGVAFGATALAQQGEYEELAAEIRALPPRHPDLADLREEAESVDDARATNALLADVFLLTAIAAAGVGVYFLLTSQDDGDASASVSAAPLPGGAALLVRGTL